MIRRRNKVEIDTGQEQTPMAVFLVSYNQNIPAGFPRASIDVLKKFQNLHPSLFKHGDSWSIAQHRKKVIDWLSSYRDIS